METPKRRALGKGLEELFSTEVLDFDALEEQIIKETPKEEIIQIPLNELRANPYQPRKVFDEESLNELASSIKEYGVFQPIIVKKSIKGYEIIAGERRARASRIAGVETIPAIVREFDDEKMMEIALLENLQRKDLTPIEEALAYQKIIETKNLTHKEFGERIGKSQAYVTNTIGLLKLPEEVKSMLVSNEISMTNARILSKMSDNDKVIELAHRIKDEGITSSEMEEIAKGKDLAKRYKHERKQEGNYNEFKYLEEGLCERLDTKVRVYKNHIEIKYNGVEQLNKILEIINGEK
ncbi:MAG: ParB/RepB/Spo0J family partition protein [Bacilli bacterium]|nr:ParB/RepB/Spo0J family partition protein [Bacilli bacterium]